MADATTVTSAGDQPEWVMIQKRTFSNWVNVQLAERSMNIEDIQYDLADGVSFCNLVELLTKETLKYNKKPKFQQSGSETTKDRQSLIHNQEILDTALNFLTKEQGVKIVNIAGEDLTKCNLRLILGLIWTLILRYHIQEGRKGIPYRESKSEMLVWVNKMIGAGTPYNIEIKNFKSDWADGRALAALTDALSGEYSDWDGMDSELERNTKAIVTAQEELEIPGILAPKDVGADEFSLVAYLEYFMDFHAENPTGSPKKKKKQAVAAAAKRREEAAARSGGAGGAGGDGDQGPGIPGIDRHGNETTFYYHNVKLTWG